MGEAGTGRRRRDGARRVAGPSPRKGASRRTEARGRHVVLYDGVCGLCDRVVRFVLARDPRGVFRFAPLQGAWARAALRRHGHDAADLDTLWVLRDEGTSRERALARSEAVLFLLSRLEAPWPGATVLTALPRPLLDRVYDAVAKSRYRLFGRHETCPVPPAEVRDRFLDADMRA